MAIEIYEPGDAIKVSTTIQVDGTDTNPGSGAKITITDPDGNAVTNQVGSVTVQDVAMSNDDTGDYSYVWQTATTEAKGRYKAVVMADGTTYDNYKREYFDIV